MASPQDFRESISYFRFELLYDVKQKGQIDLPKSFGEVILNMRKTLFKKK